MPDETHYFQRPRGLPSRLPASASLDRKCEPSDRDSRDALAELEGWATNFDAPPFLRRPRRIRHRQDHGPQAIHPPASREAQDPKAASGTLPLPIYIDLRDYVGENKDHVPTIEELLDEVIRRSWKLSERTIVAKDILRLVRDEGALIIFEDSMRESCI